MKTLRGGRSKYAILSTLFPNTFISPIFKNTQSPISLHIAHHTSLTNSHRIPTSSHPSFLNLSQIDTACRFSTTHESEKDDETGGESETDEDSDFRVAKSGFKDENVMRNVDTIMGILRGIGRDGAGTKRNLDGCDVPASPELVEEVLSRVRNDWGAAFTFFLWAQKQPGYIHGLREYHTMISILGKMKKFDTAWSLIQEMRDGSCAPSVTTQTLLILIRKFCAAHEVAKAIATFYSFKRFGFPIGVEEFQGLLSALCRYKNVQDAEYLLMCNENVFPSDTKSFNIVLNGWCNMVVNLPKAKRFWNEMGRHGIQRDAISYGSMISCYSKAGSLRDVLKMFDQMQELGIVPDRKVYNSVIYALAKGKCVKEAINLLKSMDEKGCVPNAITYNSIIKPLCKARRLEDARVLFDEMLKRGLAPSIRTYHAFLAIVQTGEEVFELLEKMKETGCNPTIDTYIMLIRKFCRWQQHENVFKIWNELSTNGLSPDRSSYIVLIHGLFLNGRLDEAFEYYQEMKAKGFPPEPKTDEMLQTWLSAKETTRPEMPLLKEKEEVGPLRKNRQGTSGTISHTRDIRKKPETRNVTRERGFSFW